MQYKLLCNNKFENCVVAYEFKTQTDLENFVLRNREDIQIKGVFKLVNDEWIQIEINIM